MLLLVQTLFIAAEIALLPKSRFLFTALFLYQWVGVLLAHRLKVRLTPSLFRLLKTPRPLLASARSFLPWLLAGLAASQFVPQTLPPLLIAIGLLAGPLAALWSRRLDPESELLTSNPLFYLQWRWWIHPRAKLQAPDPLEAPNPNAPRRLHLPVERPHILFLFLESFRAQNASAFPCFDKLAKQGVLFTECSATGPYTFYAALASLFGVQPALDTYDLKPYMSLPTRGLPSVLKEAGYRTAWIESGYTSFGGTRPFLEPRGIDEIIGAEEIDEPGQSWGVYDASMLRYAANWLEAQKTPAFAALFTLTNHHPWTSPPGWIFEPPRDLPDQYRRYLKTFAYTDACLGTFIDLLRAKKLLDNTILFITGDHGQQENSLAVSLSQQNIHVPLLIYAEGRVTPQTITAPCSHLDLWPTVADLLGLERCALGRSLLRDDVGPVYFSMPGEIASQGCRSGPYKWTAAGLYDLEKDPFETENLALIDTAKNEELRRQTESYFAAVKNGLASEKQVPNSMLETPRELKDGELEAMLLKHGVYSTVDTSRSPKLTDRSLGQLGRRCGKHLRFARLPPFITDKTLLELAAHCPALAALHAHDCPLLTALGVEAVLERCPKLKLLSLGGADEITALEPKVTQLQISSLILGEQLPIEGDSLVGLIGKCRQLTALQANVGRATAAQLLQMAEYTSELVQLHLFEAGAITSEIIQAFCRRNPHLESLQLSGCGEVDVEGLSLKWVKIE